jgi:hypothetical protein
VNALEFSPFDTNVLLTGSADTTVKVRPGLSHLLITDQLTLPSLFSGVEAAQ